MAATPRSVSADADAKPHPVKCRRGIKGVVDRALRRSVTRRSPPTGQSLHGGEFAADPAAATGEKIFHDLVEFFFDEAAGRNMLLSR